MSMPIVRATCPACGDVVLSIGDLRLDLQGAAKYQFECPCCEQVVTRGAPPRIVELLRASGVAISEPGPPVITEDAVRSFVLALDHDDWRAELRRLVRGS
jgi:predicted RNA-binding Zn-ribbon protein involved in translation (DUF1610 family)